MPPKDKLETHVSTDLKIAEGQNVQKGPSLVVVDDDRLMLRSVVRNLRRILADLSPSILSTTSSVEALELIKKEQPDIVVSDMMMPELTGLDLIEATKEEQANGTHFILISGWMPRDYKRRLAETGAQFLEKPISPNELTEMIRRQFELVLSQKQV